MKVNRKYSDIPPFILSIHLLVLLLAPVVPAPGQENLKIYGFMDFGVRPWQSMNNNSPLRALLREDVEVKINGLNLYLDFLPNQYSRAMIETSYKVNSLTDITDPDSGAFNVERAWIEAIFNDKYKIRSGKFITPAGIWNVEHGSPIITTIRAPFQTSWFPVFPIAQLGSMLHGSFFLGDHDLVYNLYASSGRSPDNQIRKIEDIAWGGHLEMKMDKLEQLDFGISAMTSMTRRDELVVVQNQIPGASAVESQDQWFYNNDTTNRREFVYGAQFKGKYMGIGLQSETNFRNVYNILDEWKRTDFRAYYILVSYDTRLNKNLLLTPYYVFENIEWRNDIVSPDLDLAFLPFQGIDYHIVGLNLGISSNMHIKAEISVGHLNNRNTSSINGATVYNQYQSGDLDVYGINTQFTMAF